MHQATQEPKADGDRIHGLDAARALAVVAMVFGHTMHATLSSTGRQEPWVQTYWEFRALTGPVFLFVSGWVLFLVIRRRAAGPAAMLKAHLPRALLIFVLGSMLRFPIWDLSGWLRLDPELWRYFSTYDALQCIATGMFVLLAVCAATGREWLRLFALSSITTAIVLAAPDVWAGLKGRPEVAVLAQVFGGGDSRYSIFPWTGYFFAGAVVGALAMPRAQGLPRTKALIAVSLLVALPVLLNWPVGRRGVTDPVRFLGTVGLLGLFAGVMLYAPRWLGRALAPVGRVALWAYVLHLPVVYGWGYWRGLSTKLGPILSAQEAASLAVVMIVGSVSTALVLQRLLGKGRWKRGIVWAVSWAVDQARLATARKLKLPELPALPELSVPTVPSLAVPSLPPAPPAPEGAARVP